MDNAVGLNDFLNEYMAIREINTKYTIVLNNRYRNLKIYNHVVETMFKKQRICRILTLSALIASNQHFNYSYIFEFYILNL